MTNRWQIASFLFGIVFLTSCITGTLESQNDSTFEALSTITTDNVDNLTVLSAFHIDEIIDMIWSPDGDHFAIAYQDRIHLFTIHDEVHEEISVQSDTDIASIAFGCDSEMILISTVSGGIYVYQLQDNEFEIVRDFEFNIQKIIFSPDCSHIILVTESYTTPYILWNLDNNTVTYYDVQLDPHSQMTSIVLFPDGRIVVPAYLAGSFNEFSGNILIIHPDGSTTSVPISNTTSLVALEYIPDYNIIAVIDQTFGSIHFLDENTLEARGTVLGALTRDFSIQDIMINQQASLMAVAGLNGVNFFNLVNPLDRSADDDSGELQWETNSHFLNVTSVENEIVSPVYVVRVLFHPDDLIIATLDNLGEVKFWGVLDT